jgi:uncharacterized protein YegP (UPF0339 family)
LEIREGRQSNPVADEVGALVAVTRPVIAGVLESISEEVVNTIGERGRRPSNSSPRAGAGGPAATRYADPGSARGLSFCIHFGVNRRGAGTCEAAAALPAAGCRTDQGGNMAGKFVVKKGTSGKYHFNLVAANGQVIATSEAYERKQSALHGIESVKENAPGAEVDDQTGE